MMRKYRLLLLGFLFLILVGAGVLTGTTLLHMHAPKAHAATTNHYFYTFTVGNMYVYDMDNNQQLIKQVSLPIQDVRGAVASPATSMLYISHGGTGGANGPGNLLKYNLLTNTIVWNVAFPSGVDSPGITPDGKTIYLPDGDQNNDGRWFVVDAGTGNVISTIVAGAGAHNTQVSLDGKRVYMGGLNYNYLEVADTSTNQVIQKIGPFAAGIRPFTFNGAQTLAFVNITGSIGFQVGSITNGNVLYTVNVQGFPAVPSLSAFSHGISLSPDEKELYLMDAPNSYVHVYDVSGLPNSPPAHVADIKLTPITGTQTACTYDCQKEGWVQHSLDGRFVYVADSGDVISTATRQIMANLSALANSRISIEIDWSNGVPVAASTRAGVGHINTNNPSNGPAFKGPVAKTWYFAEGHIGKGFREYLTVDNPDPANACAVNMQYLYTPNGSTTPMNKTVTVTVAPGSRATEPVNQDLGFDSAGALAADVATTVTVNSTTPNCSGVVVERPVYFTNYHGMASGTDVVGATQLGQNFYFADVPAGPSATTYLTILNPNVQSATVTAKYYAGGQQVQSQSLTVPANARGTLPVNVAVSAAHVAAVVTANQNVLIERPSYFINSGGISGAADTTGAQGLANDWLFAEGYTAPGYQEYLTVANIDPTNQPAAVTITLKSKTGATQSYSITVGAQSQLMWNVNQNNMFAGFSPEVSAEVKSTGANIVVQREMYFQYHHTLPTGTQQVAGISDVVGQMGPASKSAYTFAEGYTNTGYSEWLTIQNPTANTETIQLSIINGNTTVYDAQYPVGPNSRFTLDIAATALGHITIPGNTPSFEISMTIQTINGGGVFVAERPMYWNTTGSSFPTIGGSDVVGYTG